VLLPRQFNDEREVPGEWIAMAVLEIRDRFKGVSHETQVIQGHWRESGVFYRDELQRVVVDIHETRANRLWMRAFKNRWKKTLEQVEIWIVSHRIDVA